MWYRAPAMIACAVLTACAPRIAATQGPVVGPAFIRPDPDRLREFTAVAARIEPVAEDLCKRAARARWCNFRILIDDRAGRQPNAFQGLDGFSRPILVVTTTLILEAQNADELALVLAHEAAHHILGHIRLARETARIGAEEAEAGAQAAGLTDDEIAQAIQVGAFLAARSYSKAFELEADAVGTEIAFMAGYDPIRGAQFFDRLPAPSDQPLGTHPPVAQRKALIAEIVAGLRRQ